MGKDRTGAVVALLLDALGVCREDIAADYARGASDAAEAMARLRSMVSYGDAVDLYPPEALTAEPGTIHRFLAGVDDRHGGSRAFLRDHGLTRAMLDDLDALLVAAPGWGRGQHGWPVTHVDPPPGGSARGSGRLA